MVYIISDSDIQSLIILKSAVLILGASTAERAVNESTVDEFTINPVRMFSIGIHKYAVDKLAVHNHIPTFVIFIVTMITVNITFKPKAEELSILEHSVHDTTMFNYHLLKLHIYDIEVD